MHKSWMLSAFLSAIILSSSFMPVSPQPTLNINDSYGERRLWVYVTVGHPTTPPYEAANTLSYLCKIMDLGGDGIPEIVIGCADSVVAIDGRSGRLIWKIRSHAVQAVRTISNSGADYIVVRYGDVNLSLLSAVDGKALWNRTTIGWGSNTVVTLDLNGDGWGDICIDSWSRARSEVACISGATGSTLWGTNLTYSVGAMTLVKSPHGDVTLAITTGTENDSALSLLNAYNGEVIWRTYMPNFGWIPIALAYIESTDLCIKYIQ